MSLINDVLRDLERRGHPDTPRDLPPAERDTHPARRWVWWVLAAVLAGAILHFSSAPLRETPDRTPIADTAPTRQAPAPAEPAPPLLDVMPRPATAAEPTQAEAEAGRDVHSGGSPERETADPGRDEPATGKRSAISGTAEKEPPQGAPASGDQASDAGAVNATARAEQQPGGDASRDETGKSRSGTPDDAEIVIRRSGGDDEPGSGPDRLESAKQALGRGQRALAVSKLEELLEDRPGSVDARLLLARLHIEDGRRRTAGELLETGLEGDRTDPALAALYGRLLLEQDRVARARTVLGEHAPPVQSDTDYHLLLAMAHRRAGEQDAAIGVYRRVTEANPGVGAAWVGLGVSLEAKGDTLGARAAYRKAVGGDDRRAAGFARQRLAVMPAAPEAEEH